MNRMFYSAIIMLLIFSIRASAQFEYLFPSDGSINNFRETHLILRNGAYLDASSLTTDKIEIVGSKSGVVPASVVLSTDGKTICIEPALPFAYSENVSVKVKDGLRTLDGESLAGTSFQFSIRREMTKKEKQDLEEYLLTHDDDGNLISDPHQQSTYIPAPESDTRTQKLNFINIYTNNNTAPGEIFFHRIAGNSPIASAGKGYGIMEPNADSVFFRSSETDGANFHINLNGDLTGLRQIDLTDTGVFVLDSGYNEIEEVHCKNGLRPTQHEQLFFPDGTKWFTCYDWQSGWDLSQYGGNDNATVNVSWIQELDANNNVIFQWRADQHFAVTDACSDISLSTTTVDPWHLNALYKESNGDLIASFRNMDMIVKINHTNGNIIWYWGGTGASHTDIITSNDPDGGFSHQHNVHRIDNGHIMMFDNGNLHNPPVSQPKEYVLDETNLTASCVWYYTHPQVNGFNMFTKNQGSANRLSNGGTIIGYGLPTIQGLYNGAEIDANKNIVWEFRFKDSTEYSYRVYKNIWSPNVGIAEVADSKQLRVFPNPSDGIVTVSIDAALSSEITISVLNILGQRVYSKSGSYSSLANSSIDLSSLEKGFYFLEVTSGDKKMVSRILLQ